MTGSNAPIQVIPAQSSGGVGTHVLLPIPGCCEFCHLERTPANDNHTGTCSYWMFSIPTEEAL